MTAPRTGRSLGPPHDRRPPTWARAGARRWHPADRRRLAPGMFGRGHGLDRYELARRLRLVPWRPLVPRRP
jgi:hypothetical protein